MAIGRFLCCTLLLLGIVGTSGCGGDQGQKKEVPRSSELDNVKSVLQAAAESGAPLGSGSMVWTPYYAQLEKSDPAKAKALQAEFDALSASNNPADVKAKAAALLKKLQ